MQRHQHAETAGIVSFFVCAIVGGIGMWLYLQLAPAFWQMTQRRFLASSSIIAVCGVASFIVGYVHATFSTMPKRGAMLVARRIVEIVALSMVYGATLFVTSFLVFSVINSMMGRALFTTYITALSAAFAGVAGYLTFVQAELMDAKTLASLLFVFVLSGVGTACVTNDNPGWYNNNFSQLGDRTTFAATMFNVTLILGGICIMIISYFALTELVTTYRVTGPDGAVGMRTVDPGYRIPRFKVRIAIMAVLLFLCGMSFIGIGTFRYTPHPLLHDTFARTMAVWMFLLIVGLPWWAPQLSKAFYVVSDAASVVVVVTGVAWLRGLTSLTNVEALVGMLFLGWFIVFCRQIAAIEADRLERQILMGHPLDKAMVETLTKDQESDMFSPAFSATHNPVPVADMMRSKG